MANNNFNRPLPASINTTPAVAPTFPINFGQIIACIFAQPFTISATRFATMSAAQTLATWVTRLAATDATAFFATPIFSNSKIGGGKPLETAADSNLTFRGEPEFFGIGGSVMSFEFRGKDTPSLTSMASLSAFSQQNASAQSSLSAFFVNQDGDILAQGVQTIAVGPPQTNTITLIDPINFFNFWYGTQETDGYATATVTKGGIWLPPNWSDNTIMIPRTATFDIRTLL